MPAVVHDVAPETFPTEPREKDKDPFERVEPEKRGWIRSREKKETQGKQEEREQARPRAPLPG
jgi:hypothetical protein